MARSTFASEKAKNTSRLEHCLKLRCRKSARRCGAKHIFKWKRAKRRMLFDPPEPQIIGTTQCFATFLPFRAPGSSFFWDFLFCDHLSSSLLFSDSCHLCFSSVHIVGSLTSKLPYVNTSEQHILNVVEGFSDYIQTSIRCHDTLPSTIAGIPCAPWLGLCTIVLIAGASLKCWACK